MSLSKENMESLVKLQAQQEKAMAEKSVIHTKILLSDDETEKKELRIKEEAAFDKYSAFNRDIRKIILEPTMKKEKNEQED